MPDGQRRAARSPTRGAAAGYIGCPAGDGGGLFAAGAGITGSEVMPSAVATRSDTDIRVGVTDRHRGIHWSSGARGASRGRALAGRQPRRSVLAGRARTAKSRCCRRCIDDPEGQLGAAARARFGDVLPFLVKVLAADEPLSLQAHPSAEQAAEGFRREERLGHPDELAGAQLPRRQPQARAVGGAAPVRGAGRIPPRGQDHRAVAARWRCPIWTRPSNC